MSDENSIENDSEDSIRREILNTAEEWAKSLVANDAEAVGSFMSDDWVIVGKDGFTGKRDFLPHIASGDLTHETMELVSKARIQIYGDTAVLTGRVTNNGHYKNEPFSADEWTTDVFVRRGNRWLCVLSHITPV